MSDALTINGLISESHATAVEKGFWPSKPDIALVPEKLMLIVSELAEALEEYRAGFELTQTRLVAVIDPRDGRTVKRKPEGFAIELADAVIRIADMCGEYGIDLEEAIQTKFTFNVTRSFKHGKVC